MYRTHPSTHQKCRVLTGDWTTSSPSFTAFINSSNAGMSYDSGNPLRSNRLEPSIRHLATRNRPSSSRQRYLHPYSACNINCNKRAVVDLPTATEPAIPITNGLGFVLRPKKRWRSSRSRKYCAWRSLM